MLKVTSSSVLLLLFSLERWMAYHFNQKAKPLLSIAPSSLDEAINQLRGKQFSHSFNCL